MNDKSLSQTGGDGSTNIQGYHVNVNQGLSYKDVKEIATDVFNQNFIKLSKEAAEIARARADEALERFLLALEKHPSQQAINSLRTPGMQIALYSAQRSYAKSGDQNMMSLLVDLLIQRTKTTDGSLEQIAIDEAVEIAPKLTNNQINIITLSWSLTRVIFPTIVDIKTFNIFLNQYITPLIPESHIPPSCFEHIEYLGCGHISKSEFYNPIEQILKESYGACLCKGVTPESVQLSLKEYANDTRFVMLALRNHSLRQIHALNRSQLRRKAQEHSIPESMHQTMQELYDGALMDAQEIRSTLEGTNPRLLDLITLWDTQLKFLRLHSVSHAIAAANIKKQHPDCPIPDLQPWLQ